MVVQGKEISQNFLDGGQYQKSGVLRYERMFGRTYVSPGGEKTARQFTEKIKLKPGMKVLDIGCGTGGSAFFMAQTYGVEVLGIDLSAHMLEVANEHKQTFPLAVQKKVSFELMDATKAKYPNACFDVIYSRDTILHIAKKEDLYCRVLNWLKPGGQLLVTEYVHGKQHPHITKEYQEYLTQRGYTLLTVPEYEKILKRVGFEHVQATDQSEYFLEILETELNNFRPTKQGFVRDFSLKDYEELVDGWEVKIKRVKAGEQGWGLFVASKKKENCVTKFLDAGQYVKTGILRYERIFGRTYISPGGEKTARQFLEKIKLKPGMKVLDIGCGTGGSAFFMARNYGVEVVAIDLSEHMLEVANDHKKTFPNEVQRKVSFEYMDATKCEFPGNTFDVVYSRDSVIHIAEKEDLYKKIMYWLKPSGQILITEYVHGKKHPNHPQEYLDYLVKRGYTFLTVPEYDQLLKKVGFEHVQTLDQSDYFLEILETELAKFKPTKQEFLKDFPLSDYTELVEGWETKITRAKSGDQGWSLFIANKKKANCAKEFLDAGQYQKSSILRYERIFGRTYISPGGEKTAKQYLEKLNLKPGMKVLDIGCGTGGSSFFMAQNYGVQVLAIDISEHMMEVANDHKQTFPREVQDKVTMQQMDATNAYFPSEYFDVVYCREAVNHIAEKEQLYQKILHWLRPEGRVLVTEYVNGKKHPSHGPEYLEYLSERGYTLLTVPEYEQMLAKVGFENIQARDETSCFLEILKTELKEFERKKEEFLKEFQPKDFNEVVQGWEAKITRAKGGDQGWGLFIASKKNHNFTFEK